MGDVNQPSSPSQWYYLDYLQMGVMIVDEYYRIVYWNRWLENHSNIISESVEQQPFKTVFPELADSRLFELIQQVVEEKLSGMISSALNKSLLPLYPSINHQLKQMDLMRQMVQVTAMEDASGSQLAMVQVTDMTREHLKNIQIKEQSQAMQSLVSVDQVTTLANRQKFDACLHDEYRRALRAESKLVVAIVEIDHFDAFVKHYGEPAADQLLSAVSGIFETLLCRETDIIARYSAQAFGLVMPCTTEEGGVLIAQEMRKAVRQLEIPHVSGAASAATVSVGMALAQPTKTDGEEGFAKAVGFALDNAKEFGGDKAMLYLMADGRLRDCDGLLQDGQLMLEM